MRRRRGALAKVKLKMPVAVWPPPVDAEQGRARGSRGAGLSGRGGPPRRCIFTSPLSPSLLGLCQAIVRGPAEAGGRPEGTGRCAVLLGGGGRGVPELLAPRGGRGAGPGRGAELLPPGTGAVSGLKSSVQNAPGWVLRRVQQKFSKGSLVKQTLRPSTAPALPRSVMIDIFYSANFYLPCKNVGDKCDKLQICKFL